MTITIRKATKEDIKIIVNFNKAMALETENKVLQDKTITKGVARLFNDPVKGFYLLAETDDNVVGQLMITTEWSDWRNGDFWWIQSVYVKPEFRRQGIYRLLHDTVQRMVRNNPDICGIRLYVEETNYIAQETYHKLGMSHTTYRMMEDLS
ncbi:MAG: GNAT family N-acetyltransferase [Fidelibacterota bacterium]